MVEADEDPAGAAIREAQEEAGITVQLDGILAALRGAFAGAQFYRLGMIEVPVSCSISILIFGNTTLGHRPRRTRSWLVVANARTVWESNRSRSPNTATASLKSLRSVFPSGGDDDPQLIEATDRVWRQEGGARLDAYVDALVSAQDRGLPLLVGLEVDWLPGANDGIARLLDPYPFDVLLGSVHWLGSWLFDAYGDATFAVEWASRNTSNVWRAYADAVIDLVRSGHVDVIAHPDVIKVAGHRPHDVETFESRLCDALTASDTVVEISTAGWRKPADELYPSPDMLRKLHERGVAVTTASDAHRADQIGYRFGDLRRELSDIGIDVLTTFRQRRPSTVRLL